MASGYEVEVTISSAKYLKNVNWRHGDLKPYAVVWVDPSAKFSTRVDEDGDTCPVWGDTLVIPLRSSIDYSTLFVDIVQARPSEDVKPLIGSARVPLREILDDVGVGGRSELRPKLKRPSGRPHGKLELRIMIRQPRYRAPDPYYATPYAVPQPPPPQQSRDYVAPPPPPPQYRDYGAPRQYDNYQNASPYQAGPTYGGYSSYGPSSPYNQGAQPVEQKKGSKYGMGTGLAVGAVAGVLGGLAIGEGVDYVEDKIADRAADRVEDNFDGDDYGDDDY
ncbi:hypothetical protein CFOL_v3_21363 [Cephalotus follicularis]|uniref:C2 domain-containing protein n=1 Tax=Cephalotus follicularis TaxID=3775 RepID=A0A1Q3CCE1_CEPFO|nr:hypothetical protein CFOL_v3_21363 [Cephalotus follicularis]